MRCWWGAARPRTQARRTRDKNWPTRERPPNKTGSGSHRRHSRQKGRPRGPPLRTIVSRVCYFLVDFPSAAVFQVLPPSSETSHLKVCDVGDGMVIVYLDLMSFPPILSSPVQLQVFPVAVPVACPIIPMLSKPMYL